MELNNKFQNLTYKKKVLYTGIFAVLVTIIVYNSTIKKTIELISQNKSLSSQLELLNASQQTFSKTNSYDKYLSDEIGNILSSNSSAQESILEVINNNKKDLDIQLIEFGNTYHSITENYTIYTNVFQIEGRFCNLVKLAYLLETKYKVGKLASLDFEIKKNNSGKSVYLVLKIYIQNFMLNENHN